MFIYGLAIWDFETKLSYHHLKGDAKLGNCRLRRFNLLEIEELSSN